jgi:hypothetical protein
VQVIKLNMLKPVKLQKTSDETVDEEIKKFRMKLF